MTQPNIVFILIDDMGLEGPRLLRQFLLRNAQHSTASPARACALPTRTRPARSARRPRASILTGKYPATVGITDWIDVHGRIHPARGQLVDVPYLKQLPTREHSLARALNEGGYQTWHVGKWHLGGDGHLPEDHGFEVNIGGAHQGSPGQGGYFSPWTIAPARRRRCPRRHVPNRLPDRPKCST